MSRVAQQGWATRPLGKIVLDHGIRMTATHLGIRDKTEWDETPWHHDAWRCTFRKRPGQEGSFTVTFRLGMGHDGRKPNKFEVLESVITDARSVREDGDGTFEGWCREFGYDTDSRRAERMWQACVRTSNRLERLFGADLLNQMVKAVADDPS